MDNEQIMPIAITLLLLAAAAASWLVRLAH